MRGRGPGWAASCGVKAKPTVRWVCPCRRYVGTHGVYTLTTPYERDEHCPFCSPGVLLEVDPAATLQQVAGWGGGWATGGEAGSRGGSTQSGAANR